MDTYGGDLRRERRLKPARAAGNYLTAVFPHLYRVVVHRRSFGKIREPRVLQRVYTQSALCEAVGVDAGSRRGSFCCEVRDKGREPDAGQIVESFDIIPRLYSSRGSVVRMQAPIQKP